MLGQRFKEAHEAPQRCLLALVHFVCARSSVIRAQRVAASSLSNPLAPIATRRDRAAVGEAVAPVATFLVALVHRHKISITLPQSTSVAALHHVSLGSSN